MLQRDQGWIEDIVGAISEIQSFVPDMDYAEFLDDPRTQHAVLRLITIVGEATKNLAPTVREGHPEIPWRELAGFRDMVVHNYRGVDLVIVWQAATLEFPKFLPVLEAILASMKE